MKNNLILLSKTEVSPQTYYLIFGSETELSFKPGQLFTFKIEEQTRRPYSIVSCGKTVPFASEFKLDSKANISSYVSFLISTKSGSKTSLFFETVEIDTEIEAIGPTGSFALQENTKDKVFVATGTGLGPFIPMIRRSLEINPLQEINLFFAVWNKSDDFSSKFFADIDKSKYPNLKIFTVIDDFKPDDLNEENLGGRVTTVIPETLENLEKYDFYLCGHPAMVTSMEEVLETLGVEGVYKEKYG